MKVARKILIVVFLCVLPVCAAADEKMVWIEATGEAYLGDLETPMEVKQRARLDARKNALETAVGVFIKSHTLISNGQLADDLIYAAVRGKIERDEILSEGWDETEKNVYRAKIKALIRPLYPEKGEGLFVKVTLSKIRLKENEAVKIFYEANRDCYVYLFSIAADGSVTLLMPNSDNPDNFTRAGALNEFPPPGSRIRLQAMFLPGFQGTSAEERIKLIATKEKEPLLSLGFQEGMFEVYDSNSTGMISDLLKKLNRIEPADWTETAVVYTLTR